MASGTIAAFPGTQNGTPLVFAALANAHERSVPLRCYGGSCRRKNSRGTPAGKPFVNLKLPTESN